MTVTSTDVSSYLDYVSSKPGFSVERLHSIKCWPLSQRLRCLAVDSIIKQFTTPSDLSQRFGLLIEEEAEAYAKLIEPLAFWTANRHFEKEPDDGHRDLSAVLVYTAEFIEHMVGSIDRRRGAKEDREAISKPVEASLEAISDISGWRQEEAEELLKSLKEPGKKYTRICFSNRSFGLDAMRVAAPILSSLKDQVMEVDLSGFIAGRAEAEAVEVMTMFSLALEGSELRYLNLSNNALGEKGVRAFRELLKSQGNLDELYLMNGGISKEAAKAVCELIPSTKKLKILHFHDDMTGDEGGIAISGLVKESPMLVDFTCSSMRIGVEGGVALAEALGTCTHLKKLNLQDNMFGAEAGIALSKAISAFANLTEVYLSYLNLEDEGSRALANALKYSAQSLKVLEMAGNDITSTAAPALAACLTAKKGSLAKLNLSKNKLKDQGAVVIAKALEKEFAQLMEVDLRTNAISRAGARLLAQAVVHKPGFKLLIINGNFLSDEGVEDVKEIFKNAPGVLGHMGDNDPEGEEDDEEPHEDHGDTDGELKSKLQGLEIKQEE